MRQVRRARTSSLLPGLQRQLNPPPPPQSALEDSPVRAAGVEVRIATRASPKDWSRVRHLISRDDCYRRPFLGCSQSTHTPLPMPPMLHRPSRVRVRAACLRLSHIRATSVKIFPHLPRDLLTSTSGSALALLTAPPTSAYWPISRSMVRRASSFIASIPNQLAIAPRCSSPLPTPACCPPALCCTGTLLHLRRADSPTLGESRSSPCYNTLTRP